jgi:hypothetical protein
MARAPTFALKYEDYSKLLEDYPQFEVLLRNLNRFATQVDSSLNRGTTFAENIPSQEMAVEFDTDAGSLVLNAPIRVALKLPAGRKPKHVTVTRAETVDATTRKETPVSLAGPAWSTDGATLLISGFGALEASKHYKVTVLVIGN